MTHFEQTEFKMSDQKQGDNFTILVSDSFKQTEDKCRYEVPFRRWLIREIEEQKITIAEAVKRFNFNPQNGGSLIAYWRQKYAPAMVVSLPDMTQAEKQKLTLLQQQLKTAEKQLEDAKMKNIALNMLIDVAEEKLKISIRKKPGAKQ